MRSVCRGLILMVVFIGLGIDRGSAQGILVSRPHIGLALGGGGALGFAHIGVLRYLEENRIPVHFIAGTSMGGVIAGFYATGHRSSDIEEIVRNANWDNLFRLNPKFENRPVAEKQEWNRITGPWSFQLGRNFSLPIGMNPGAALALLLSRETLAYSDVQNFDELPIPFRCVATDLVSAEAVILQQGILAKALRATTAIPAIFTPVQSDNRILVDGGLVNNLPTDVAKAMGADFVIGVTLHVSPAKAEQLQTIPGILRQTATVAVLQNESRNRLLADISIEIPLGDRESSDFSHNQELIEAGYQTAKRYADVLKPLALSPDEWSQYLREMDARRRTLPPSAHLSSVDSPQEVIREDAQKELSRRMPTSFSTMRLEDEMAGLIAVTGIPSGFYTWVRGDNGGGYRIQLEERPGSQVLIRPAFFFQSSPGEPGRFTFRLDGSAILKNDYKSRILADVSIGDSLGARVEAYRPMGGSSYFMAPGVLFQRKRSFEYDGEGWTSHTRSRIAASLYVGIGTWRHLQLRAGSQFGYDHYDSDPVGGRVSVPGTAFSNTGVVWTVNTEDSGDLPDLGTRINGSSGWNARKQAYPYFQTDFEHFQPVPGGWTLFGFGKADSSLGHPMSFYEQFTAGGLTDLDAYRVQELRANSILALGGGFLMRRLNPGNAAFRPIPAGWYEAAGLESGGVWDIRQSASAGVIVPTPIGKIGLIVSLNELGRFRFRLSLGSFWNRP